MSRLTGVLSLRLLNKIGVVSIVLLSGCGGGSNSNTLGSQNSKLTSSTMQIEVFEKASMTLAVSEQEYGQPGDMINLFAYTYETETEIPISDGSIEFSSEYRTDSGTTQIPIGSAPLIGGRATITWTTPVDSSGKFDIKAKYLGGTGIAPSEWQFSQYVSAANDKDAVVYAMARLNHIVNLMKDSTIVDSEFEDGPESTLSTLLSQEFGLELLETYYRLEGGGESFTIYNDLQTFLSVPSRLQKTVNGLCIRSTFFLAANDDVLLLVIKGTDGTINKDVNNEGSPARLTYASKVAVHPGWAWMTNKLMSGFAPDTGCSGTPNTGAPYFSGFTELVKQYRHNSSGKNRKLYITGHSLGGALARMSMLSLAENGVTKPRDRVFTFGAPRQGAYNTFEFIGLDRFEPYARALFVNNELELTVVEGNNDPIPPFPDNKARSGWDDSISKLESALEYLRTACGVLNKISNFFEAGDACDENVSIKRPIGFDEYSWGIESFRSNSHHRRFINGDITFKRCDDTVKDINCSYSRMPCVSFGINCKHAFHKTDVGTDDDYLRRMHWVGDYEYNSKLRLRGEPTQYNYYFPINRRGKVRMPLNIVPLP